MVTTGPADRSERTVSVGLLQEAYCHSSRTPTTAKDAGSQVMSRYTPDSSSRYDRRGARNDFRCRVARRAETDRPGPGVPARDMPTPGTPDDLDGARLPRQPVARGICEFASRVLGPEPDSRQPGPTLKQVHGVEQTRACKGVQARDAADRATVDTNGNRMLRKIVAGPHDVRTARPIIDDTSHAAFVGA